MRSTLLLLALIAAPAAAQRAPLEALPDNTSGAPMPYEQAAVDVTYYDLALAIRPADSTIAGTLTAHLRVVHPTDALVFDLDAPLAVSSVERLAWRGAHAAHDSTGMLVVVPGAWTREPLDFERRPQSLRIALGGTAQPGENVVVAIAYAGAPRVAPRPPWVGGFTWARAAGGQPWVGVSVQGEGADAWWPTKDHPSDKADSVTVALTVPEGLTGVANGRLRSHRSNEDGTDTFVWHVSNPISNYGVSAYVAPYERVDATFASITGESVPVVFWVLPERADDARRQLPEFIDHLAFLQRTFGPYPFRRDGYQVVHSPYLGMEHQSAIAYGDEFDSGPRGFDWLHFHELAHEWWANLVTAPDWRDFWIHESLAEYAEALYAGELAARAGADSMAAYRGYLDEYFLPRLQNVAPVAPTEPRATTQMYFLPDGQFNGDIYFKGAMFFHTLRWMLGDEAFFDALRRLAYPEPAQENAAGCEACRFVSTSDVQATFERAYGRSLAGVFAIYLRQPALPTLEVERAGAETRLRWLYPTDALPAGAAFDVPVEVEVDGRRVRVEMPGGEGSLTVPARAEFAVDPDRWLLRGEG